MFEITKIKNLKYNQVQIFKNNKKHEKKFFRL